MKKKEKEILIKEKQKRKCFWKKEKNIHNITQIKTNLYIKRNWEEYLKNNNEINLQDITIKKRKQSYNSENMKDNNNINLNNLSIEKEENNNLKFNNSNSISVGEILENNYENYDYDLLEYSFNSDKNNSDSENLENNNDLNTKKKYWFN